MENTLRIEHINRTMKTLCEVGFRYQIKHIVPFQFLLSTLFVTILSQRSWKGTMRESENHTEIKLNV